MFSLLVVFIVRYLSGLDYMGKESFIFISSIMMISVLLNKFSLLDKE